MNDRYNVYDKQGNRIGTVVSSANDPNELVGLLLMMGFGLLFLWPLYPFYACYNFGRNRKKANIFIKLTIILVILVLVMPFSFVLAMHPSSMTISVIAGFWEYRPTVQLICALCFAIGYLRRPKVKPGNPEDNIQYQYTPDGIIRIDEQK